MTDEAPHRLVLVVEDNPADVTLIRRALAPVAGVEVEVVRDGEEAVAFLRRQPPFESARRPALVLLDLNLPRKDGREVLAEMKTDSTMRRIPFVVLSTSSSDDDVADCYDLSANCYVTKPLELRAFQRVIAETAAFWLETAVVPRR